MKNPQKHCFISTAEPLSYSLINVKVIEFEKSLLVTCKVLRLFVNTPTADDKYSFLNRGTLTQPIQMHLSEKQKGFSQLFCAIFKSTLNFEHFETKMTLIAYRFLKSPSRQPIERHFGKRAKTLFQPQQQHIYHIHLWL